jgi:NitT/TauT family transport system substrate-binding protein
MNLRSLLMLCGLAVPIFVASAHADTSQTVTLGISGLSQGKLPIFVATDRGYFKKRGVTVNIIEFSSGGSVVQAFVGGSVDLCICAGDHVIDLHDKGLDVQIVTGLDEHNADTLVARAASPYADIASLKGQKIAITSPGSYTDNSLRWALRRAGLDPRKDVEIVSTGTGSAMLAAISSGRVAAGVLTTDQIIRANQSTDKLRVVDEWRDIRYTALVAIAKLKWVVEHPDLAKAFAQAVAEGARDIQSDPAEAQRGVKLIFPREGDAFAALLAEASARSLTPDGSVSADGFKNTQDVMHIVDPSLAPVPLTQVNLQPSLVE